MTFNRECEYALKGLAALAAEERTRPLTLSQIAAREGLPPTYLSKIFQKLLRYGLLQSHRGAQRGYTLNRPASSITLRQALEAIEGPDLFHRCLLSHHCCDEGSPCVVNLAWRGVRRQVQEAFEQITLQHLVDARRASTPIARIQPDRGEPS